MATYISLVKYTQQGIGNIKESPARVEAFKQLCQSMGAELKEIYWTMGRYDIVVIVEAPDAKTVQTIVLRTAMAGNVRTETLTAFPEEEYQRIIAEI